jgi:CRP-like cAMP-binding protein
MHGLVSRLREVDRKIHSLAMFSVHDRVARYLLENAVKQEQGQLVVIKKLSHAGIAREVSASREMVSRAMKSFESSSFIKRTESGKLLISIPPPNVANETSTPPDVPG